MTQPNSIRESRTLDWLAYGIASGGGAGFAPIAPGTVGAFEGVLIFLATGAIPLTALQHAVLLVVLSALIFGVGVWASGRVCSITGVKDPRHAVVDEIGGQLIAMIPLTAGATLSGVAVSFVMFRLFDILKTPPIDRLERLPGGLGVMADDYLAGVYAGAVVWAARLLGVL